MSDVIFAALLAVAFSLIAIGAETRSAGLIVGGVLLGIWSWLVLGGDDDVPPTGNGLDEAEQ